jgi:menaquinone-dependent protoporphyrinogen oxidase
MHVLVSAGSKHGSTLEIADAIGDVLTDRGLPASVVPPDQVETLERYQAVVLGSGVYAGHWTEPARHLVRRLGDELASRPVWLFSSGPIGDPPKPADDPVDVREILERTGAREHRVFPGRVLRRLLSFPERAIVAAFHVPDGDFRDWDAIRAWASQIADSLTTNEPGPSVG